MSLLRIFLIDVGWGDSILLETRDDSGAFIYGLIDSNDTTYNRSSYLFIKRHFEKRQLSDGTKHHFEFVMLSHEHADHAQGLKAIMKEFGAKRFWYPKSLNLSSHSTLIDYANRSSKVVHHEALNSGKILPDFGGWSMEVLWPTYNWVDPDNPNNNSIVLQMSRSGVSVVLTGDAEAPVWDQIANRIPADTRFFKVPHHGSVNGTFGPSNSTPWLDHCPSAARLAMSTHIRPYQHPHQEVVDEIAYRNLRCHRTDVDYHICFESDGNGSSNLYYHHV